MSQTFMLDGKAIPFEEGQTIIQAATKAGVFIPHLCYHPDFKPHGSCKLCTVKVNGRQTASCTMRAIAGMVVESDTEEINAAVRGALAAGATEIVAVDCHGAGGDWSFNSYVPDLLHPACDWVSHHKWGATPNCWKKAAMPCWRWECTPAPARPMAFSATRFRPSPGAICGLTTIWSANWVSTRHSADTTGARSRL